MMKLIMKHCLNTKNTKQKCLKKKKVTHLSCFNMISRLYFDHDNISFHWSTNLSEQENLKIISKVKVKLTCSFLPISAFNLLVWEVAADSS